MRYCRHCNKRIRNSVAGRRERRNRRLSMAEKTMIERPSWSQRNLIGQNLCFSQQSSDFHGLKMIFVDGGVNIDRSLVTDCFLIIDGHVFLVASVKMSQDSIY